LDYLANRGEVPVRELYDALRTDSPQLTEDNVTNSVWRLVGEGKLDLAESKLDSMPLGQFLRRWELNLSFYISLIISLAAIMSVYVIPSTFPFVIFRWILGSLFVLFVPGYVAVECLFGFAELDSVERIALSIGLSLALTMVVGLLLNYTPWGIRLTPIVIMLTAVTLLLDTVALLRRYTAK
jgi:uncharacterized membrane protein